MKKALKRILVTGDIDRQQLLDYYRSAFEYVEVHKQPTSRLEFVNSNGYRQCR